jgi:hypothetical protein
MLLSVTFAAEEEYSSFALLSVESLKQQSKGPDKNILNEDLICLSAVLLSESLTAVRYRDELAGGKYSHRGMEGSRTCSWRRRGPIWFSQKEGGGAGNEIL